MATYTERVQTVLTREQYERRRALAEEQKKGSVCQPFIYPPGRLGKTAVANARKPSAANGASAVT
jgi:hypothetical protein